MKFYEKYKQIILYVFFGGLTTLVSLGTFWVADRVLLLNEHIANIVSWIVAVLFAFVTNRRFVFEAAGSRWAQLVKFYGGRLTTLGIEELMVLIFITWLGFDSMAVKLAAQVVVLVLNFVVSKWFVFRKT